MGREGGRGSNAKLKGVLILLNSKAWPTYIATKVYGHPGHPPPPPPPPQLPLSVIKASLGWPAQRRLCTLMNIIR